MNFKCLQTGMNILPMMQEVGENFDDFYANTYRQDNIACQKETMSINLIKGFRYDEEKYFDDTHTTIETSLFEKYPKCREIPLSSSTKYGKTKRVLNTLLSFTAPLSSIPRLRVFGSVPTMRQES